MQNLDLCDATVELVALKQDKISGYDEGQYLEIAAIKRLTDAHLLPGATVDWNKHDFFFCYTFGANGVARVCRKCQRSQRWRNV